MKSLVITLQVLIMFLFLQSCEKYEMVQYGEPILRKLCAKVKNRE